MARKMVLVSDLSGKEIEDGNAATLTAKFSDARRGILIMDVTADEAKQLMPNARQMQRRGRRPKSEA